MATAVTITVPMQLSKETKGSFRYDAVEEDAPMRDVYVRKSAFNGAGAPHKVSVTLTSE